MFRIIWNYGLEGWQFEDKVFATATDALVYAMTEPHTQFNIVEEVVFVSAKSADNAGEKINVDDIAKWVEVVKATCLLAGDWVGYGDSPDEEIRKNYDQVMRSVALALREKARRLTQTSP